MTEKQLDRLLDNVDEIKTGMTELRVQVDGISQRLDKINGSVQRHEQSLNEVKQWIAVKETTCKSHLIKTSHIVAAIETHRTESKFDNATVIKVAGIVSLTVLAVAKASGPIVDGIMGIIK